MNMPSAPDLAPPAPRSLAEMQLPMVMMRDILLKTIFRKNTETVVATAEALCLPVQITQELIDLARNQRLLEVTG
ncbi:MAG: ATPase, partial [Pseudodonghicola sp.]